MKTFLSFFLFWFFFFLPKKALSWVFTRLFYVPLPLGLARLSVKGFAHLYSISLSQAEKPLKDYTCIGDFFSRRLRHDLRPMASKSCVHPVDGTLLRVQTITEEEMYQAKGQSYDLCALLGERKKGSAKKALLSFWKGGLAFTYYLCPRDYHRIHCPFDAKVVKVVRLNGTLWPVHAWARDHVSQLFCRNERVLIFLTSRENPQLQGVLVCIGALNVGSIVLAFQDKLSSLPLTLKKGQEAATFRMGSSVVFLCNDQLRSQFLSSFKPKRVCFEEQVQMGEAIANER